MIIEFDSTDSSKSFLADFAAGDEVGELETLLHVHCAESAVDEGGVESIAGAQCVDDVTRWKCVAAERSAVHSRCSAVCAPRTDNNRPRTSIDKTSVSCYHLENKNYYSAATAN